LDVRAADAAGNTAEALDAGATSHHGMRDELVPRFSGAGIEENFSFIILAVALVDAVKRDFQREAGPSSVGDDKVTAAAKNEKRKVARARVGDRLLNFGDGLGLDEILRWAADFKRGQRSERNVFEKKHE